MLKSRYKDKWFFFHLRQQQTHTYTQDNIKKMKNKKRKFYVKIEFNLMRWMKGCLDAVSDASTLSHKFAFE